MLKAYIITKPSRNVRVVDRDLLIANHMGWLTLDNGKGLCRSLREGRDVFYDRAEAETYLRDYVVAQIKKCAARLTKLRGCDIAARFDKAEAVAAEAARIEEHQ